MNPCFSICMLMVKAMCLRKTRPKLFAHFLNSQSDFKDSSDKKHRDKEKMKHKDGSTDKYKDKHKEKRKEEKVNY